MSHAPDIDPFELEAVLDLAEQHGAPPHLVAHLRALVRAETWGWDLSAEWADMPTRQGVARGWREYGATPTPEAVMADALARLGPGPTATVRTIEVGDVAMEFGADGELLRTHVREGRVGLR